MPDLNSLIHTILNLPPELRTRDEVIKLKRAWAKEHKQKNVPTNIQVLKTYYAYIAKNPDKSVDRIEGLLRKRSIRSESGIVAVQVLTKPFRCPGKCIFCPTDATMPKSYINTQPGAMRALLNQFDPYKQVYNRLLSLTLTGHKTDKIEMIVLGGTRDVYPRSYKTEFVKGLYDACNSFGDFVNSIEIDFTSQKAARYTHTEDLQISYPDTIQESIKINETAKRRIIGLTVETRPEYVTDENCQFWRSLGVTRIEMGIQTLHDPVHIANKRGHDNQAIRDAMHRLRQYGFKISNHYMPGLYMSTPEMDEETFRIAFSTPWIKSDELKFYPTAVIPNTGLYDLYQSGEYTPIQDDDLVSLIRTCTTTIIPPYARIKRLARDFDSNEVVAGANTPNLRQLVMNKMAQEYAESERLRQEQYMRLHPGAVRVGKKDTLMQLLSNSLVSHHEIHTSLSGEQRDRDDRVETYTLGGEFDTLSERNFVSLCTRSREYRNKKKSSQTLPTAENSVDTDEMPFLVIRRYRLSNGEELFISFEDRLGYLYGFTRLLLPDEGVAVDYMGVEEGKALIRELHVYGSLASLVAKSGKLQATNSKVQHTGLGTQLMQTAEQIAQVRGYSALSVISGVGVRGYYEKLGYELEGTYMVKALEYSYV